MPLVETVLTAIVQKAFNYALDQGQNKVVDWAQDKLGLEPRQQAFKRALGKAYKKFEKRYPQWAADLFDASFLEHEGAFVLAQFLLRDGYPNPSELALRWADSLNMRNRERRTTLVRELEPTANDFLQFMTSALKAEPELSDLNDSRAFEQLATDLKAIRRKLDAEQATLGTRWDYLHWLIERTLYLDPRGTFQTQRQVLVKLDEVYISLRAQRDKMPGEVDRRLLEKEMAQLEVEIARANRFAEEAEDQREHLLARIENRLADAKTVSSEVMELAEAVNRHERLVILGDPGSGKSTLLRYLALKHAQALDAGRSEAGTDLGTTRLPILIRIADYAEHGLPRGQSLSSYLADYYAMHECPNIGLADLLATELAGGNCLVLLDGLDEIVNADDRRKVVERVEDFIRYHDNRLNRFVITSRIAGYRSVPLGNPFVHYTVQEMDEAQIRYFLERWCTAVEAAQAPDLSQETRDAMARKEIDAIMKAVQTSPGVRRVASNPLLLRTLALIHRTSAQLPQKRIELYQLAADTLARTWRTAQGVPESALVEDRYITRLLGSMAYWLHTNKAIGIATEREVYRHLGQEWARIKGLLWDEDNPDIVIEVNRFLRAVREHTGLFVERAPRRYGFMHLTFEEYYTARYLVARSKDRAKFIRKHLHHPRWEEPILLALGFVGLNSPEDAAELLETAILAEGPDAEELDFTPSPYEELLGRDYLFALRCLGDNIPAYPRLTQHLAHRLGDELLYQTGLARFSQYRCALNERLEDLKGSEIASLLIPQLFEALNDDAPEVRIRAAENLRKLEQTPNEILAVFLSALHDNDAKIRIQAVENLGKLEQPSSEVQMALLSALHDEDPKVRGQAVESLGRLEQTSPEVLTALITAFKDSDFDVNQRATKVLIGLGQVSPEIVRSFFLSTLNDTDIEPDAQNRIRGSAAWGLAYLGQASPEVTDALVAVLSDTHIRVTSGAAFGLGKMGQVSPEVIKAVIAYVKSDDIQKRRNSALSLGHLKYISSEVLTTLIDALKDSDRLVRHWAAVSLGLLKQAKPEVVTALSDALHDDDPSVCASAAESLKTLDKVSHEVISTLIRVINKEKNYLYRQQTAELLGQMGQGNELTIQALWSGLSDKQSPIHADCVGALVQLSRRFPDAAPAIEKKVMQALADPEFDKYGNEDTNSLRDSLHELLWNLIAITESEKI